MATDARRERVALTREVVIDAALAHADAEGLEAVTFRRLASALGVTPMALYRYVASKEELLAAISDRVFQEFELPDGAQTWQEQLRALARSYRRVLVAHPAIAAIDQAECGRHSISALRIVEVLLGVLRSAGFTTEEAALLHDKLERFVLGLVLLETGGEAARSDEEQQAYEHEFRAWLVTLPRRRFPHVMEAADYLCRRADPRAAFELALDLLIGGLEQLLEDRDRRADAVDHSTVQPK